jgi:glycosyltransferase involved in cell wall biosynthesis
MKVLIGINPKGHLHLATDELVGLSRIGLQCQSIRYGRRDYSVSGPIGRVFDTVFNSFNIISTLYKTSPDVLYLHSRLEPVASIRDFITVLLVRCFYFRKLKIAIKSHGSDMAIFEKPSFLYKRMVVPYLARHVDLWLFLSHEEKNIVNRYKPGMAEKIVVTCNIIDPSRLIASTEFKKKYHLNNDKLKILFIGRVINEKGVFEFLMAIPLVDRKERCDFILAGDGEDLHRVRQLAVELGVAPYVRILG